MCPWHAVEVINGLPAFRSVWQAEAGPHFEALKLLCLQPTTHKPQSYPCPRNCGCWHRIKGIVQLARDEGNTIVLATGKTKPSDATLADFRALRRRVNKAALSGRLSAYYLDTTWESALPGFRTQQEPNVYQRLPDGTAILDGYPIVWTDILTPYGTTAAADKPLAVFGALRFLLQSVQNHVICISRSL